VNAPEIEAEQRMAISTKWHRGRLWATLALGASAAAGAAVNGCSSGQSGGFPSASNSTGAPSNNNGLSGGNNTLGGGGNSTGSSPGSGGSASNGSTVVGTGSTAVGASSAGCVTANSPVLIDFNRYSPSGPAGPTGFDTFFGSGASVGYIGPYAFSGGSGDGGVNWTLTPVTGSSGGTIDGSTDWAIQLMVTNEAVFGAGLGFWMSCVNAQSYSGISFWARGQTPVGTCSADAGGGSCFTVSIGTAATTLPGGDGGVGTCSGTTTTCVNPMVSDRQLSLNWAQYKVPWSMFTGGMAGGSPYTPNGAGLIGLSFGLSLTYTGVDAGAAGYTYVPVPSTLNLQIDDIELMP
jgi:hypothetical protein